MSSQRYTAQDWRRLTIVAAYAIFVALAGLWSLPPLDRDEARFAQATTQMLETGDYITIRFQDRERNKKPAGIYWMQAAAVIAFSDHEARQIWAYRLPSVLGAVLAVLFTFGAARRLYDSDTAMLAALLLASAPLLAAEATIAKTDAMLLAMICLAQYALIEVYARARSGEEKTRRWPIMFWFAQGIATLIKGPIGLMISFLTGAALFIADRQMRLLSRIRPFLGIAILIVIVAPWAFAIYNATDGRFFEQAIGGDMLGKVGTAQESHIGPPGYHLLLTPILFWPAVALLVPGFAHIWRDRAQWQARFLLAWLIPGWVVFELSATKLPHYVLPLYPALAIIAAHAVMKDGDRVTRWRRLGAVGYAIVGLIASGAIAVLPFALSADPLNSLCILVTLVFAAATCFIAWQFWLGKARRATIGACITGGLYAWALMNAVLPTLNVLDISPNLSRTLDKADLHPLRDDGPPLAIAGYSEPSAVFLLGTDVKLTNGADAAARIARGEIGTAVIEERQSKFFFEELEKHDIELETIDELHGLNYSNGDLMNLTIFVRKQ